MKLKLFVVNGHSNNKAVMDLLSGAGIEAEAYSVPPTIEEYVPVPYLQAPTGERFHGLDGIKFLVEELTLKGPKSVYFQ